MGPSEQKPIKNFGEKERGRIQGLPSFWVQPIISGMGKATNFKFCMLIHSRSEQKPITNFGKTSRWRTQGLAKFFTAPIYTVWVKKISRWGFLTFFPKRLVQILRAYYTFPSTLDDKFLFNYLQLWLSYAILSATTQLGQFTSYTQSIIGWNARVQMFAKVIDSFVDRCLWQVITDLLQCTF